MSITFTFFTGVVVTTADVSATSIVVSPRRTVSVWRSPAVSGDRPSFSSAICALSVVLMKSMPSTAVSRSPRRMPAAAAGEPGSTIAAIQVRGAVVELTDHVTP